MWNIQDENLLLFYHFPAESLYRIYISDWSM